MIYTIISIFIRIISNSYINVYQKILTNTGQKSSQVNFFTYLGLAIIGTFFINNLQFTPDIIKFTLLMGMLGTLGNYFIIKALSIGELSTLAPINSYKPVVALFIGYFYLKEIPTLAALLGIILIVLGTYFILGKTKGNPKAITYRVLALIFSGSEAIIIKKIITFTSISESFGLWAIAGFIFSSLFFVFNFYNKPTETKFSLKLISQKTIIYQLILIIVVGIMQYSTNFIFERINVSYALALFQLSTLLSVFIGVKIFNEKDLKRKLIGSAIMLLGAVILILC